MTLPLPLLQGHRPIRMIILDCGRFSVRGGARIIGIPAYLIETDHGAKILVDGGFPPAYWTDIKAASKADGLETFGALIDSDPGKTLPAQLALAGTALTDITAHVLTHGHIDHVGALPLITCPLILTATERADPAPRYYADRRPLAWPDVETITITGQTALCDGLTLVPTPGHTPGHLSVLLTLPRTGHVILAADALNRASEPAEHFTDAADPACAMSSAADLFQRQTETGALLIYGHDPAQWPTLRKAPDAYL